MTRSGLVSLLLTAAFALPSAVAQKPSVTAKPDFSGTWHVEGKPNESTVIQHVNDKITIRELAADGKLLSEVNCGVKGAECSGRVSGVDAKVVFYFMGPVLVQTTDTGNEVTRTHRTMSEDLQKITEETTSIVPPGKPSTRTLVKSAQPSTELHSSAKVP